MRPTASPAAAPSAAAANPAGPPPTISRSYDSTSAGGHRRKLVDREGLLVDPLERPIVLRLAEPLVQELDEVLVALRDRPRAVLHVERLVDRGLVELAGIGGLELREQVVLDDDAVGAARRHLEEGGVLIRQALDLRVREQLLGELLAA